MQIEFKIVEIYNPNDKQIEEKLNEAFILFLTEKLIKMQNYKIQK